MKTIWLLVLSKAKYIGIGITVLSLYNFLADLYDIASGGLIEAISEKYTHLRNVLFDAALSTLPYRWPVSDYVKDLLIIQSLYYGGHVAFTFRRGWTYNAIINLLAYVLIVVVLLAADALGAEETVLCYLALLLFITYDTNQALVDAFHHTHVGRTVRETFFYYLSTQLLPHALFVATVILMRVDVRLVPLLQIGYLALRFLAIALIRQVLDGRPARLTGSFRFGADLLLTCAVSVVVILLSAYDLA